MESIKLEYRAIIKFVLNEGCKATTAHQCLVAVYSYSAPNYSMVTRRFNKFERGRQSLEDDLQSGRPSNAVNARISRCCRKTDYSKLNIKGDRDFKGVINCCCKHWKHNSQTSSYVESVF